MQTSRSIGLCLNAYAIDHDGHYPEGKTSTEVFQHLLDEKYLSDPTIFYVPMPGKAKPESNHLTAENVSWDVTCCLDSSAPDHIPVVYLTGYKITYQAGAPALPSIPSSASSTFIAVYYKDNTARSILAKDDGSIPDFITAGFDPKGKTYRQLTP